MFARSLTALAVALATAFLAACGGGSEEAESGDDPGPEGITIYSGRIAPLIGPLIDMEEEQTEKDIQTRFGDSPQLAATLIEEGESSPADVFLSQDASALEAVDEAGLLTKLPDDILERVPARFRAEDGDWVGTSARSRVVAYDSRELGPEDLPDSVLDFTDPEWEGRVGWAPPNASLEAYVSALRAAEGDEVAREWVEGMVANDAHSYDSNTPIRDAIAAGEIDVGLINHYYVAQAKAEEGEDYPVDIYFPPNDLGALVNVAGVGVLESSERKEESFDFIRFALSRTGQEYFVESSKEYPVIEGVEGPEEVPPLDELPSPDFDLADFADLQGTVAMLQEAGAL
ncbi:MAG TPA: iron ABC transporter substrate-binding protein [Solirubrobacterales bacterium]